MRSFPCRAFLPALALALLAWGSMPVLAQPEPPVEAETAGGHDRHAEGEEQHSMAEVLVVQTLGFLILGFVLVKFVVPPIRKVLAERTERIRSTYATLEKAQREVEEMTREYQARLAGIEKEAADRIARAIADGQAAQEQILAEARAHAEHVKQKAETEIELEKEKAIAEIRNTVIEHSFAAARRLAAGVVDEPVQDRLVDAYLDEMDRVNLG